MASCGLCKRVYVICQKKQTTQKVKQSLNLQLVVVLLDSRVVCCTITHTDGNGISITISIGTNSNANNTDLNR